MTPIVRRFGGTEGQVFKFWLIYSDTENMLVSQLLFAMLGGNESMSQTVTIKVIDMNHEVRSFEPCVAQVNHATNELEIFVCDTGHPTES